MSKIHEIVLEKKTEMHTDHQTIMIYSLEIYHSENSQQLLGTDLLNNLFACCSA